MITLQVAQPEDYKDTSGVDILYSTEKTKYQAGKQTLIYLHT